MSAQPGSRGAPNRIQAGLPASAQNFRRLLSFPMAYDGINAVHGDEFARDFHPLPYSG